MAARWLKFAKGRAAWAEIAADTIAATLGEAIARRDRATLVLAGGSTPRPVYERLAEPGYRATVDWSKVVFLWGDERCVPPDSDDSNYHLAHAALLSKLPATGTVCRIEAELGAEEAASRYDTAVRRILRPGLAGFDLVLLGLGTDGHTASLFPGGAGLDEPRRLVMATRSPLPPYDRVSLTLHAINMARHVTFLVAGADKAAILARVFDASIGADAEALPAALVQPRFGRVLWLADDAAAAQVAEPAPASATERS